MTEMTESSVPAVRLGSGDHVVLCLHGWFGSATGWGPLPEMLDGDRFSYYFMDYRGYGARRGTAGEHAMAEIAADALGLADQVGAERFSVVGHSMGGMAAARVLVEAPRRVRSLVALTPVSASGYPFDDPGWALFSAAVQDDAKRATIIDLITGNRLTARWIDQMVQHSVEQSTREAFGDYLVAWGRGDFSDRVAGDDVARVPIKVMVGEHDPAIGADLAQQSWLKLHPGAELEVIPNAGHYPMWETPVVLATTIEEFLSRP
jgi:pimeloyl-ACP methyl ester carboxylesterase